MDTGRLVRETSRGGDRGADESPWSKRMLVGSCSNTREALLEQTKHRVVSRWVGCRHLPEFQLVCGQQRLVLLETFAMVTSFPKQF